MKLCEHGNPDFACVNCHGEIRVAKGKQGTRDLLVAQLLERWPFMDETHFETATDEQIVRWTTTPDAPASGTPTTARGQAPTPPDLNERLCAKAGANEKIDEHGMRTPSDVPVFRHAPGAPPERRAPGSQDYVRKIGEVSALTPEQFARAIAIFQDSTRRSNADAAGALVQVRSSGPM